MGEGGVRCGSGFALANGDLVGPLAAHLWRCKWLVVQAGPTAAGVGV